MLNRLIESLVDLAVEEDIGDGDHSTLACVPKEAFGKAKLLVKETGIIAGVKIAQNVFHKINPNLKLNFYIDCPIKSMISFNTCAKAGAGEDASMTLFE